MKDLNMVVISGKISGVYKSGFAVEISREYAGKDGPATSTTKVFVKGNDDLLSSAKEGKYVVVSGSLSSNKGQDGKSSLCIYAFGLVAPAAGAASAPKEQAPPEDDIPF
jgi:hypothetical protein